MSVGTPRTSSLPVTAFVRGSMRETVLSWVFSSQTAPSPTATLLGAVGDSMKEATSPSAGFMTARPLPTVPSPDPVTASQHQQGRDDRSHQPAWSKTTATAST